MEPHSGHSSTQRRGADASTSFAEANVEPAELPTVSPIEAQRAVALLEEAIERLSFLGSITPDVLTHKDELSRFVGEEISRIVEEQKKLEAKYEQLITERMSLKGLANKMQYKVVQAQISDVSNAVRESTKQLCQNLKDNPNISGNLMKIQRDRTELIEVLMAASKELREKNTYGAVAQQVAQAEAATARMADVVAREERMSEAVRVLDKALTEEKQTHQAKVAQQRETIEALKEQLQAVKSAATVSVKYVKKQEAGASQAQAKVYTLDEQRLIDQARDYEEQLKLETLVHEESAAFLARKQHGVTVEIEKWTAKLEEEGAAKGREVAAMKEKQMAGRERLDVLQARKQKDDAAEAAIQAAKAQEAEAKAQEAALEAVHTAAALKVQKQARAMLKRKAEAAAAGGKKGKKGKGKGGKKKK